MITLEEKQELVNIVNKFRNLYTKISELESMLNELEANKDQFTKELEANRQYEKFFTDQLVDKYGAEVITPDFIKNILLSC